MSAKHGGWVYAYRILTASTVDDVHDGLASYLETLVRADELAGKLEWTDELTDEEVEIGEKAIAK